LEEEQVMDLHFKMLGDSEDTEMEDGIGSKLLISLLD